MKACDWLRAYDKDMIGSWQAILGSGAAWARDARQRARATSFNILSLGLVSNNRWPAEPLLIYTTQLLDDKGSDVIFACTMENVLSMS